MSYTCYIIAFKVILGSFDAHSVFSPKYHSKQCVFYTYASFTANPFAAVPCDTSHKRYLNVDKSLKFNILRESEIFYICWWQGITEQKGVKLGLVVHIYGTFDLLVFKVIWGLYGGTVTLERERSRLKSGTLGILAVHIWCTVNLVIFKVNLVHPLQRTSITAIVKQSTKIHESLVQSFESNFLFYHSRMSGRIRSLWSDAWKQRPVALQKSSATAESGCYH